MTRAGPTHLLRAPPLCLQYDGSGRFRAYTWKSKWPPTEALELLELIECVPAREPLGSRPSPPG